MEAAHDIQWYSNSYVRLLERAAERQAYGNYHGHPNLGGRLLQEVQNKIKEISQNLNLYPKRDDDERVASLSSSNFVLIYKKEYFKNISETKQVRLLIIDIRKSY